MNRYVIPAPRAALALAAIVLTALTIGLSVVFPAMMTRVTWTLEASEAVTAAASESFAFLER